MNTEALLKIPYRWNGRDPAAGLDCWGLVLHVCELLDHPVPIDWTPRTIREAWDTMTKEVDRRQWQAVAQPAQGDVAALHRGPTVQHVGICVPGGILHTTRQAGRPMIQTPAALLHRGGYDRITYHRWIAWRA